MDNKELKQALFDAGPVLYNGIKYQKVHGILYRVVSGKLCISAELLDFNNNCLVYAPAAKVESIKEACGEN